MVPKIPLGMKRPIEGSFETLVALHHFSGAGEHTKHASVLYLLLFFFAFFLVDPVHKSCIESWQRGKGSPWKRAGCNGKKK